MQFLKASLLRKKAKNTIVFVLFSYSFAKKIVSDLQFLSDELLKLTDRATQTTQKLLSHYFICPDGTFGLNDIKFK